MRNPMIHMAAAARELAVLVVDAFREIVAAPYTEGMGNNVQHCRYQYFKTLYLKSLLLPILSSTSGLAGTWSLLVTMADHKAAPFSIPTFLVLGTAAIIWGVTGQGCIDGTTVYEPRSPRRSELRIIRLVKGIPESVADYKFGSEYLTRLHLDINTPTVTNHEEYLIIDFKGKLVHYVGYRAHLYRHVI